MVLIIHQGWYITGCRLGWYQSDPPTVAFSTIIDVHISTNRSNLRVPLIPSNRGLINWANQCQAAVWPLAMEPAIPWDAHLWSPCGQDWVLPIFCRGYSRGVAAPAWTQGSDMMWPSGPPWQVFWCSEEMLGNGNDDWFVQKHPDVLWVSIKHDQELQFIPYDSPIIHSYLINYDPLLSPMINQ